MQDDREARRSPELPKGVDFRTSNPRFVTLAGRLSYVFEKIRPPKRQSFSFREVANAISTADNTISATYINQLCTGTRDNPRLSHIQMLSKFFGIPIAFLAGDGDLDPIEAQIEMLSAKIREVEEQARQVEQQESLLVKLRGVSEPSRELLEAMLDHIHRQEGVQAASSAGEEPKVD
jgi:transcriptional regulator with XRE-family HTH domain